MNKLMLIVLSFSLLASCNKSKTEIHESLILEKNSENNHSKIEAKKNLIIVLNQNLTFEDLLKADKFKSLLADEDVKDYIYKYWRANSSLLQKLSIMTIDTRAEMNILEQKVNKKTSENDPEGNLNKLKGLFSLAGKGAKGAFNSVGDTYKLVRLESEKESLIASFSKEKQKAFIDFETDMNKITEHSYQYLPNKKVKENDILQNYKSLKESLKSDKNAKKLIEKLGDKVDDFYYTNSKVKELLAINKLVENTDYSSVVEYGQKIISSPDNQPEVKIEPSYLNDYFDEIRAILQEVNNPKFDVPFEDWSEEKQANLKFIYDDIRVRISNEINSLNFL